MPICRPPPPGSAKRACQRKPAQPSWSMPTPTGDFETSVQQRRVGTRAADAGPNCASLLRPPRNSPMRPSDAPPSVDGAPAIRGLCGPEGSARSASWWITHDQRRFVTIDGILPLLHNLEDHPGNAQSLTDCQGAVFAPSTISAWLRCFLLSSCASRRVASGL